MLKIFKFIGCFLERSERNYPRIFWLCTSLLGFCIFHEPVTTSSQSQIVIEQVRISRGGGSKSDSSSFVTPTNPYEGRKDSSQRQGSGQSQDYSPKPKIGPNMGGGGGGGSGSDDAITNNDILPPDTWKADSDYWKEYQPYLSQNKKKLSEQCDLDENSQDAARTVTEKLDESNSVKKLVNIALNNQDVKNEYGRIKKRLEEGANPIDIGPNTAAVAKDKVLIKGAHGRYLVEVSGNQVNVLGICSRGNKKNVNSFERLMNEMYDVNLQY